MKVSKHTEHPTHDAEVIGRFLIVQNALYAISEARGMAEFVCQALRDVPGAIDVVVCIKRHQIHAAPSRQIVHFEPVHCLLSSTEPPYIKSEQKESCLPEEFSGFKHHKIQTINQVYGCIFIAPDDETTYSPYRPFIDNLANHIAVILENRAQEALLKHLNQDLKQEVRQKEAAQQELLKAKAHLEQEVIQRTQELYNANQSLSSQIEERERIEKNLLESEKRFRAIFEQAAVGVALVESGTGRFVRVNRKYGKILGLSETKLLTGTSQEMIHADDLPFYRAQIKLLLEGRQREIAMEIRYLRQDGSITWANMTVSAMWATGQQPDYHITVVEDITDRKNAEKALAENEMRYRDLFNETPFMYIVTRESGAKSIIGDANNLFLETLKYSREEVLGQSLEKFHTPESIQNIENRRARRQRGSKFEAEERTLIAKDGEIIHALLRELPDVDAFGNTLGTRAMYLNITERKSFEIEKKNLEAQLVRTQKMEAIGSLAGGIAHDFNNILFPLMGYAEILQQEIPAQSELQDHLNQILKSANRAKNLVGQILTFSRQAKKQVRPLKVQLVLKEVLKLMRATLPSTIDIKEEIDPKCGLVVADPTHMHQVAMNIMTNAYHVLEETGGTITIGLHTVNLPTGKHTDPRLPPGSYVCLNVADTGEGMDPITLEKIFDPYFTTKAKDKGTGLGLSVVHGIVKTYGGEICVQSGSRQGTVFDIYLPCSTGSDEQPHRKEAPLLQTGNERILVVDDEELIAQMVTRALDIFGYTVESRTSSVEAMATFLSAPERIDLIITDMTMPHMTGEKLAIEVKKIRPDVPIILCTGFSEKMTPEHAKNLGIDALLLKPITLSDLSRTIRNLLDAR